jgi:hypothetical protein
LASTSEGISIVEILKQEPTKTASKPATKNDFLIDLQGGVNKFFISRNIFKDYNCEFQDKCSVKDYAEGNSGEGIVGFSSERRREEGATRMVNKT